jgi:hypothetical protein
MRALALALALALCPAAAHANGRFPAAQQVVFGVGAFSSRITFRTTFGLLVSDDAGGSFRWLCEGALFSAPEFGPSIDPAVDIDARGRTVYGFRNGLRWWSQDQCGVQTDPALRDREVLDLTSTPDRTVLYGIETPLDETQWILRARSDDLAFTRRGSGIPNVRLATIDVAPTNPQRLWLSGLDATLDTPLVLRSDDGGETVSPVAIPARLLGEDVFIAAMHPTDPDALWLRANVDLGSTLVRVREAGRVAETVARTPDRMLGFARSADGRTVWYGSINAGLYRSDDGGDTFARVNPLAVICLAVHDGALWACGDWLRGPFALGRSTDGGRSFTPVLQFRDLVGPVACAATGIEACEDRWPMLQRDLSLAAMRDAGARRDATIDASDVPAAQGDATVSRPPTAGAGGCGCGVPRGDAGGFAGALAALAAAVTSRCGGRPRARGRRARR